MSQFFEPGDFLIFQLESGFGLLRVLAVEDQSNDKIWHIAAYSDLFPDVEFADNAISSGISLSLSYPHVALTNRAFESTQAAKMVNIPLSQEEIEPFEAWKQNEQREISDRSIRLLLGLR